MTQDHRDPAEAPLGEVPLCLTYQISSSFHLASGVRIECSGGSSPVGRVWPLQSCPDSPAWAADHGRQGRGSKLPARELSQLLVVLRSARLEACSPGVLGADGTTYSLSLVAGLSELRLSWWEDLPAGWRDLQPLLAMLERHTPPTRPLWEQFDDSASAPQ